MKSRGVGVKAVQEEVADSETKEDSSRASAASASDLAAAAGDIPAEEAPF